MKKEHVLILLAIVFAAILVGDFIWFKNKSKDDTSIKEQENENGSKISIVEAQKMLSEEYPNYKFIFEKEFESYYVFKAFENDVLKDERYCVSFDGLTKSVTVLVESQ